MAPVFPFWDVKHVMFDHWSLSRLVPCAMRGVTRFVKWPKNIRLQRNGHVSSEVSEDMTVIPAVVFLLLGPVESLVSFVTNSAVGSTALEFGGRV